MQGGQITAEWGESTREKSKKYAAYQNEKSAPLCGGKKGGVSITGIIIIGSKHGEAKLLERKKEIGLI